MTKNISEINRNLEAIEQTRHITNAMYLLSVSAMRKSLSQVDYSHRYMRRLCASVKDVLEKSPDVRSSFKSDEAEYLGRRDTAFFVIGSDKSLCGAYNYNVAAEVENRLHAVQDEGREAILYTAGTKLAEILKNHGVEVYKNFDGASQYPTMQQAYRIAEELIDIYKVGYVQDIPLHIRGNCPTQPSVHTFAVHHRRCHLTESDYTIFHSPLAHEPVAAIAS